MNSGGTDRAQSIQIGAVLLFGALVIALSLYQAVVVPDQNKQVEFKHSVSVQGDLQTLRDTVVSMTEATAPRSVTVELGTRYPTRVFAVNPGPPGGALRTVGTTNPDLNVTVVNATTTGETGDFWTGTERVYPTGSIGYRPNYNVYRNAPDTFYGSSVLHNEFPTGNVTLTGQTLVSGNRITLTVIDGNLSQTRSGPVSVDIRPVSSSGTTITVTKNSSGGNITVSVPTRLGETEWERLLASETDATGDRTNDRFVTDVSVTPIPDSEFNRLRLELENATYRLQLTKVAIGTGATPVSDAYLTDVSGDGSNIEEGSSRELVVEVRDAFNNPVGGVRVNASATRGTVSPVNRTTDEKGRAAFTYDAEENVSDRSSVTRTVRFSTEVDPAETGTFNSSTPANVTMNVMVENTDGSGLGGGGGESTGSSINPNSTDAVVLTNSTIVDPQDKTSSRINITLRNRDQNDDRDLTEARFNFYSIDRQSSGRGNRRDPPKAVEISNTVLKSANVGGEYRTIDPIPITAGNSTTFTVEFYKNSGGTAPAEVKQGDFFVVSVIFENGRDATYFIAPTE